MIASFIGLAADSTSAQEEHQDPGPTATPAVGGGPVSPLDVHDDAVPSHEDAAGPARTTAHSTGGARTSLLGSQTEGPQAQAGDSEQNLHGPAQTAHAHDAASARQSNAPGGSVESNEFDSEDGRGTRSTADSLAPTRTMIPAMATFTLQDGTYTAQRGSGLVLDGTTLSNDGAAVTTAGRTIQLTPSGVMIDGQLAAYRDPQDVDAHAPDGGGTGGGWPSGGNAVAVVTFGGQSATVTKGEPFVVGSNTLLPGGPAATTGGRVVSMAEGGVVVDGTRTVTFSSTRGSGTSAGSASRAGSSESRGQSSAVLSGSVAVQTGGGGVRRIGGEAALRGFPIVVAGVILLMLR